MRVTLSGKVQTSATNLGKTKKKKTGMRQSHPMYVAIRTFTKILSTGYPFFNSITDAVQRPTYIDDGRKCTP
jgi:hypothetical protein